MEISTALELKKLLNSISDEELNDVPIRVVRDGEEDIENHWIYKSEISTIGSSGYPNGELRFITSE